MVQYWIRLKPSSPGQRNSMIDHSETAARITELYHVDAPHAVALVVVVVAAAEKRMKPILLIYNKMSSVFFLQFFYHKLYSIYFKNLVSDVPYFLLDDLKCFCNNNDMILRQMKTTITNNTRELFKGEKHPNTKALIREGKSNHVILHFTFFSLLHNIIFCS